MIKNINTEFRPSNKANVQSGAPLSHSVIRGSIRGSDKSWIRKEMPDPVVAKGEMMAQEFFRLMTPHQPETRLMVNPDNGIHYILSEEVPGYRNLPAEPEKFKNGSYTGLGQVMVGSLYLQEIDLKNGNVGLDDKGRVIKIDGDWCFAQARLGQPNQNYPLTERCIHALPRPQGFYAFNWLDYVTEERRNPQSSIVGLNLQNAKHFRNEVNQSLLKICLVPDAFLKRFVEAHFPASQFPAENRYFIDLMKQRRDRLQASALQNHSFKAYLKTAEANDDALSLTETMNSFVVNGETKIIPLDLQNDITLGALEKFDGLKDNDRRNIVGPPLNTGTTDFINHLLEKIEEGRVNDNDKLVNDYIKEVRQKLQAPQNKAALREIFLDVQKKYNSVCSPEAQAVKHIAQDFRRRSGLFTIGMKSKAKRIEDALIATPLDQRRNVITVKRSSANAVQEALASRRIRGRKNMLVHKDSNNQIDEQRAAQTYKKLKNEFEKLRAQRDDSREENKPEDGIPPLRVKRH